VSIFPDDVFVGENQSLEFTVTVSGSAHPESVEVDLAASPLQGSAQISYNGDSTHTVNYMAPGAPDVAVPDLLTVRHTAQSGARGYSSVERLDIATIRFGDVRIVNVPPCLEPGHSLQMEVEFSPGQSPDLVWSASAGTITQSGLFTAPNQPGTVEITVALEDNPDVKDSISVTVGCVCHFTVQVGADPVYVAQPGDTAEYYAYQTGDPGQPWSIAYVNLRGQSGRFALFAVDIAETLVTGPGAYDLTEIGGQLGYAGAPYGTYDDDGGILQIYEFEPHTAVVGEATGDMRDTSDPGNLHLSFSATFSIYPPPQPAFGVYRCQVP
jgi:hypothetical protein